MADCKIILANSNPTGRQALRMLVAGIPDLEIMGAAGDGPGILELFQQKTPDLVILDIFLPHIHGLAITIIIKINYPRV